MLPFLQAFEIYCQVAKYQIKADSEEEVDLKDVQRQDIVSVLVENLEDYQDIAKNRCCENEEKWERQVFRGNTENHHLSD